MRGIIAAFILITLCSIIGMVCDRLDGLMYLVYVLLGIIIMAVIVYSLYISIDWKGLIEWIRELINQLNLKLIIDCA